MFLLYPLKVSIPQIGLLGLSAKVKKKKNFLMLYFHVLLGKIGTNPTFLEIIAFFAYKVLRLYSVMGNI